MTSQLPAFLKQVSTTSDTVLLFKEDKNPVLVIREVGPSMPMAHGSLTRIFLARVDILACSKNVRIESTPALANHY